MVLWLKLLLVEEKPHATFQGGTLIRLASPGILPATVWVLFSESHTRSSQTTGTSLVCLFFFFGRVTVNQSPLPWEVARSLIPLL